MPVWTQAGLWGLLAGSALLLGAVLAYLVELPRRATAGIMAFGCGVLIAAVAYDLLLDRLEEGGLRPILLGALSGSLAYAAANWLVARRARRRKHAQGQEPAASEGGGVAIVIGSLLDGIPEAVILGASLLEGTGVSTAVLAAILLSNVSEGLSSAVGMRRAGRSRAYVLGLWAGIALVTGLASAAGVWLLADAGPGTIALVSAVVAGALLTMVADTMIPEAVEGAGLLTGVLVVLGLLVALALSHGGWGRGAPPPRDAPPIRAKRRAGAVASRGCMVMASFWIFHAVCVLGAALPPARLGLRALALQLLPATTLWLLAPTSQPWDVGAFDILGKALASATVLALLAGLGLRWLLERAPAVWPGQPPDPDEEAFRTLLHRTDPVLAAVAGLCVGPFLTLALALALRGAPGGTALHLATAALAMALAVLALRRTRGLLRPFTTAALAVLAAAALLGALRWPALIEARAAEAAGGAPFCLRSGDRLARPEETMLLTLPRGRPGSPGLILTVETAEGPRHHRWSYRASAFVTYGTYARGPCPLSPPG
jgi:ZIP family zinc transporter